MTEDSIGEEEAVTAAFDPIAEQQERMRLARESEAEHQRQLNEEIARNREAAHLAYTASEQGQCHAQIEEAERIMRLPTPEAHKALGSAIGDPLKGPSS